ncbi:MAG: hypothetical protein HY758_10205 [Nitrospirae bacterium]|nr:hypothetical protein [Nitrospirota bacterium]
MKIKVVTNNKDHEQKLLRLVPYKIGMMEALSKEYKFKPPAVVLLKPMRERKETINLTLAWAGYSLERGYYISLRMTLFKCGLPYVLDVLAHETAHIAVCQKLRRWGHPQIHEEMYQFALKWVKHKGKRCC